MKVFIVSYFNSVALGMDEISLLDKLGAHFLGLNWIGTQMPSGFIKVCLPSEF